MLSIAENIKIVKERIEGAAKRIGRDPSEIKLVAVSKTVDIDRIKEAVLAGIEILGENKVQEAKEKISNFKFQISNLKIEWQMVGHLQTNKAKTAVQLFSLIHSVDSFRLAEELDRQARNIGKIQRCLIEVNLGGEGTKYGVSREEAIDLVNDTSKLKNISIEGLMVMPPFSENPDDVRPYFKELRKLKDEATAVGMNLPELSMGMSNDFEVAIEEGSTMVRIGTAIFGERK